MTVADGLAIARDLIARERVEQTGKLDLRNLGLTEVPVEVCGLVHLRELQIGNRYPWEDASPDRAEHGQNTLSGRLSHIVELKNLQTLDCSSTQIDNLALVAGLANLRNLHCSGTQVADLAPVKDLTNLQNLHCSGTQIANLAPVKDLANLQNLNCSSTQIADLAPVKDLANLQNLDCSSTRIADLAPIKDLVNLQTLYCAGTQIANLAPVKGLANLQNLDCSVTNVIDLAPVKDLANLQNLYCSYTQIADLAPVKDLANLQNLFCSSTQIADLAPVKALANLQKLDCSDTQIADLAPVKDLANLQNLYCSDTQVIDLAPVKGLANLQELDCSDTETRTLPDKLLLLPELTRLYLRNCRIDGVPAEVLSGDSLGNCLTDLRAHMADQAGDPVAIDDVKLLILGNGKAGKTQLANRLSGKDFNQIWDSTHGIRIGRATLPGEPGIPVHIWDFGGQDIYHGTHALFARSAGVFLAVWAADTEGAETYVHQGITFRNHPLPYWLAQARHHAGGISPVVVVQTKCDSIEEERRWLPADETLTTALPYGATLHFSSRNDRGRANMIETLRDAIAWHRKPERGGNPLIGRGRLAVRQRIEVLRDADANLPVEQRRNRWIEAESFRAWCAEDGRISDPDAFLRYLHNAGVVFHRPNLFDDRIILDQQWALDAVYAVFNRESSYRHILAQRGRFTRPMLGDLVWREHSVAEQELLLSMMRTSGICFVHRANAGQDRDAEYIAPDLLPARDRVAAELDDRWAGSDANIQERRFAFPLLHRALIRALICRIGEAAHVHGVYWQGGTYTYDRTTRSRALIEHTEGTEEIVLRARGGAAEHLLDRLSDWIGEEASKIGLSLPERSRPPKPPSTIGDSPETPSIKTDLGPEPRQQRSFFVSYAWGSNAETASEVDRRRGDVVEQLCSEAAQRGIKLHRDKDDLGFGDRISAFMDRMIEGDRIAIILSAKYLQSPWCMTELCGIWRMCGKKDEEFRRRVRVFVLPDAAFSTLPQRLKIAAYWQEQHSDIQRLIAKHGTDIIGELDFRQYKLIGTFLADVGDILVTIADTVRPVTEEDFHTWTLDNLFEAPGK